MRLKGRVALITGAAGGIGEATALLFAEEGAKVVVQDMDLNGAQKVVKAIEAKGGEAIAVGGNVTVKADCEAAVKAATSKFGKLEILVNNAGINRDSMVKKMTEDSWDAVMGVNLKGAFLMCQASLEPMTQAGWGRICNTASIGALGNIGQANYSASKAGVIGMTNTMALEFAKSKINVNCVAPGATETQMTSAIPAEIKKAIESKIPQRRFASPREIACAHLFLCSDEASYVTGQTLFVDGGISVGI